MILSFAKRTKKYFQKCPIFPRFFHLIFKISTSKLWALKESYLELEGFFFAISLLNIQNMRLSYSAVLPRYNRAPFILARTEFWSQEKKFNSTCWDKVSYLYFISKENCKLSIMCRRSCTFLVRIYQSH